MTVHGFDPPETNREEDLPVFDTIYREYREAVFSFAFYLCRDRGEAEDLFQEAWLRIVKHLPEKCEIPKIKAWIFTIVSNLHKDLLRKKRVRRVFFFRSQDPIRDGEETGSETLWGKTADETRQSEMKQAIQDAITDLPERQRRVFILKEVAGFQQSEVSDILGIPLGTVKSLMHRAVKHLQRDLSVYGSKKVRIKCGVNTLSV